MASPPRTSSATETRREGSARGRRGSATRGREGGRAVGGIRSGYPPPRPRRVESGRRPVSRERARTRRRGSGERAGSASGGKARRDIRERTVGSLILGRAAASGTARSDDRRGDDRRSNDRCISQTVISGRIQTVGDLSARAFPRAPSPSEAPQANARGAAGRARARTHRTHTSALAPVSDATSSACVRATRRGVLSVASGKSTDRHSFARGGPTPPCRARGRRMCPTTR